MKLTLIFTFFLLFIIQKSISQCTLSNFNLGLDTILCPGSSLNLQIPSEYSNIVWQNSSTMNSFEVLQSGEYYATSTMQGENLIVNGDFELGNIGFNSEYFLGSSTGGGNVGLLTNPRTYEITTTPSLVHINFNTCFHEGNMMVVNSAESPNLNFWCQGVTVEPNHTYTLSAEVTNTINYPVVPTLRFTINNTQVGGLFSPSDFACDWVPFSGTWNSLQTNIAIVCISNTNLEGVGNDFAIDNIKLIPTCVYSDTIQVDYEIMSLNLVDTVSFCSTEPEYIVISSTNNGNIYEWNSGEINDSIIPQQTGYSVVTITSENKCLYKDSTFVNITTTPTALFSYDVLSENVPYTVSVSNESINGNIYTWDFSNGSKLELFDENVPDQIYSKMGDFKIKLIAFNGLCSDTLVQKISLYSEVKIPNVFTPNGDSLNDYFEIKNLNDDRFQINIINRWGQIVFESKDIQFKWDGKDKSGNPCSEGTYFYDVININFEGEKKTYHGNIQLIKD